MKRIAMIGNCQIEAMAGLYQRFVSTKTGDVVDYIRSYEDLSDNDRTAMQQADVIVEQLFDLKQKVDIADVAASTPRVYVPFVTAGFLWPFAGSPHPSNPSRPDLLAGPYGAEASDSYLNRLILAGADPDDAVDQYLRLDVATHMNLDRLYELVIDRQRSRDAASDFDNVGEIERYFRVEPIFLSPYHPNARIACHLADRLFQRLGVDRSDIDRMRQGTTITPFPKGELPIHPSVARHFGLTFVSDDRRYRFMNEGTFTFEQFARRYMKLEWNEPLEEGLSLSRRGELDAAAEKLTEALALSPRSAAAHHGLYHVLMQQGQLDRAMNEALSAVLLEPDDVAYRVSLGHVLQKANAPDEAEHQLRTAVALAPRDPHYHMVLAHHLWHRRAAAEAIALMRQALEIDPYLPHTYIELAHFLEANGNPGEAEATLRQGLAHVALGQDIRDRLVHLLARQNRHDETLLPVPAAEAKHDSVVQPGPNAAEPPRPPAPPEQPLSPVEEAGPVNADTYARMGDLALENGDLTAAERAFRRSIELDPRFVHSYGRLGYILTETGRHAESIATRQKAIDIDPSNPHWHMQLGHGLMSAGELAAAEKAMRTAIAMAPRIASFHIDLSHALSRDGRMDDAIAAARQGIAMEPANPRFNAHFDDLLRLMNMLGVNETASQAQRGITDTKAV